MVQFIHTMLKRSGFRKKTLNEVIAQQAKKKRTTGIVVRHRASKKVKVHWKPPAWFMAIPTGSHGSSPVQKRLWKLTSDFVRIYDFEMYGVCASCGKIIGDWKDGDAGHYKAWAVCNNYFKFNRINLAYQCSNCNRLSDGVVGTNFGETLKKRRGQNILQEIELRNNALHGGKFDNVVLVQMAQDLLVTFSETFIKPDYYEKVIEKIED